MNKTEKKNQHFLPQFYLRNFSFKGNGKQIGLYNFRTNFFYSSAKIKGQCSKKFFYGEDGIIEDKFSSIEGNIAAAIRNVIEREQIDSSNPETLQNLLKFIALTDLRNPVTIDNVKSMTKQIGEAANNTFEESNQLGFPELTHDEVIEMCVKNMELVFNNITDLQAKLIFNETSIPFIIADHPVVLYNQFLEQKKWSRSRCGYGSTGLQIFCPISPQIILVLFDKSIYKVGGRKRSYLNVDLEEDVNSLNLLQFLNRKSQVFFNDKVDYSYIQKLNNAALSYSATNVPFTETYVKPNEEGGLVQAGTTEMSIGLQVKGIKVHSNASKIKLEEGKLSIRPHVLKTYFNQQG